MAGGANQSRDSSTVGPAKVAAIVVITAAVSAGVTFSVMRRPVRVVRDPEVVYVLPPAPVKELAVESPGVVEAVPSVRAAHEGLTKVEPSPVPVESRAEESALDQAQIPVPTGKINLNTATQAELELLPDVGPKTALAIIEYRKAKGPFKSIADLDKVNGIGERTMRRLAPLITVD